MRTESLLPLFFRKYKISGLTTLQDIDIAITTMAREDNISNWIIWLQQPQAMPLTHLGRVTHIWISKLTIIGSDNGLSPDRRPAIIWTNAGILLIGTLGTNFSEISIGIQTFSLTKMHLKMSSVKWHPFGLGLNVLRSQAMGFQHHPLAHV